MIFLSGWKSAPLGFFSQLPVGHAAFTTRLYIHIHTHTHSSRLSPWTHTPTLTPQSMRLLIPDNVAGYGSDGAQCRFVIGPRDKWNAKINVYTWVQNIHHRNHFPRSHFIWTLAEPYCPCMREVSYSWYFVVYVYVYCICFDEPNLRFCGHRT